MLAFLLLSCAQALNPAALAREALVEYRANEERIAPDKVLAKVLRTNPCTDAERRAAAESFLGTAARLRAAPLATTSSHLSTYLPVGTCSYSNIRIVL